MSFELSKILAVGAHIGDAELMAGPYMCESMLNGSQCHFLALTAGERGNPGVEPKIYKAQKLAEAIEFSRRTGILYDIYDDIPDSNLLATNEVIERVKTFIINGKFDSVLTHWRGSFHPDHRQAHEIVTIAVFQLNLLRNNSHHINLFYCENWEDMDSFRDEDYFPISRKAFQEWRHGVEHIEFIYGTFSKFRYLDYYTSLLTVRGCLAKHDFAVSMMLESNL